MATLTTCKNSHSSPGSTGRLRSVPVTSSPTTALSPRHKEPAQTKRSRIVLNHRSFQAEAWKLLILPSQTLAHYLQDLGQLQNLTNFALTSGAGPSKIATPHAAPRPNVLEC